MTRLVPLWFGLLGPPVLWAARFAAAYALVPYTCDHGDLGPILVITIVALLGTAAAGLVAWGQWRAGGGTAGSRAAGGIGDGELGGADARARFMALVGMLGGGLFALVIVVEALALFFIDPCQAGGVPL